MKKKTTQTDAVLNYMKQNKSISSWTAIEKFGATRLADIIYRLKRKGYLIKTERKYVTTRYGGRPLVAVYTLIGRAEDEQVS